MALARRWQSVDEGRLALIEATPVASDLDLDAVRRMADSLELDIATGPRRMSDLRSTEFPSLCINSDGAAELILDRSADGIFTLLRDDALCQDRLEDWHANKKLAIFCFKPRVDPVHLGQKRASPKDLAMAAVWRARDTLSFVLIASFLSNLFMLAVPLFTMAVYDRVVPHLAFETLWALAIGVCLVLFLDFFVRAIKQQMLDGVSFTASRQLQGDMFDRLLGLRLVDRPKEPGTLARSFADLDGLCRALPAVASALIIDLPFFCLILVLIASLAGWVAAVPLVGAILLGLTTILSKRWSTPIQMMAALTGNQRGNFLVELQSVLPWIKLCGADALWRQRWSALIERSNGFVERTMRMESFNQSFSSMMTQIVTVAVLIVGVYQIALGEMTVGALVACSLLAGRAMAPVISGIGAIHRAAESMRNLQSISNLWEVPGECAGDQEGLKNKSIDGGIQFKQVSITFEDSHAPALHEVDLSVESGETVALIGRNGSGKSTLLKLIARLYDPDSGGILLDGHDLRQHDPHHLRRQIGLAPQEPWLVDGTVRSNLMLGLDEPDQQRATRVLTATGVAEFVQEHPNGLGQKLGARGENLSSGQRQSIILARALLPDTPIVLLDEPTAHLDQTREQRFVSELQDITKDRTVIFATHRLATLRIADRVVWLERGKVVMDRPRDEAIAILSGKPDAAGIDRPAGSSVDPKNASGLVSGGGLTDAQTGDRPGAAIGSAEAAAV